MRLYKKSLIVFLVFITFYICFSIRANFKTDEQKPHILDGPADGDSYKVLKQEEGFGRNPKQVQTPVSCLQPSSQNIKCNINGDSTVDCLKQEGEVYVPFSFIRQYFEIYGEVKANTLFWQHSNVRVIMIDHDGYKHDGVYMSFDHYNVEGRERVFCVTGASGVPYSTQWAKKPYPYAIQISQFGLSHFSKFLRSRNSKPEQRMVGMDKGDWEIAEDCMLKTEREYTLGFSCPAHGSAQLPLSEIPISLSTMSLELFLHEGSSLTVVVQMEKRADIKIVFTPGTFLVTLSRDKRTIRYGIGAPNSWVTLTRSLAIDLKKGLLSSQRGRRGRKRKKRGQRGRSRGEAGEGFHVKLRALRKIVLRGKGKLHKLTFASNNHWGMFIQAARWLVRNQGSDGGWAVPVGHRISSQHFGKLHAGWHSAMAQGHAMSVLSRAYKFTDNATYLEAALRGTQIYEKSVAEGGVQALFADKYPWFEEYPTTPSLFVLNGFIYSLIGLYDLSKTAGVSGRGAKAFELYSKGLESLNAMLPLFDTGSGTFYDLRHVTVHATPNLARWDYHSTHITQLFLLSSIDKENPLWLNTAQRWLSYSRGVRAPHN